MTVDTTAILAVDGNSLGHRAFHSLRGNTDDGPHALVGAVVSMLAATWRFGPYGGVVVAFDHPHNRRKHDWPEYKANRSSDPRIGTALDELRCRLDEIGIATCREHGAEADDLLAAAVDDARTQGWRSDLLSSDRDLIALVADDVRLLRPPHRFGALIVEDRRRVEREYGIEPHQYHDLAAIRGDASDGLEGAPGVGTRTAARLLREYGSVEEIYRSLDELSPRVEAALRASRQRIERNVLLMAPIPHLTVDVRACVDAWNAQHVHEALAALGETTAARRFLRAITQPPPPSAPPPEEPADTWDRATDRAPSPPAFTGSDGEQTALF